MKAIIPAKASSIRVPNKNFRPFYGDLSLFDIAVQKLLQHLSPDNIYMSCEQAAMEEHARRWDINFLLRDAEYADNYTPFPDCVRAICDGVPDDDLLWCHVVDPLFDSYGECIDIWRTLAERYDSLVVVYPRRLYLLDASYRPEGFGFGHWHIPSQELPMRYELSDTAILRRGLIHRLSYHVGVRPHWFHAENYTVDIDTEQDFEIAQVLYEHFSSPQESSD